jgi:hypothetical protein
MEFPQHQQLQVKQRKGKEIFTLRKTPTITQPFDTSLAQIFHLGVVSMMAIIRNHPEMRVIFRNADPVKHIDGPFRQIYTEALIFHISLDTQLAHSLLSPCERQGNYERNPANYTKSHLR